MICSTRRLAVGNLFKVSSPSPAQFEQVYRQWIGQADYVFSIHLGARLGSSLANAVAARSRLPASTTRVELIDSKSASIGAGSVAIAAARAVQQGATPAEVSQLIHATIRHTHAVFFVDTLEYLEQSGRLTLTGSMLGSMQRIKPLMILDEGEIVPYERTRPAPRRLRVSSPLSRISLGCRRLRSCTPQPRRR